MSGTRSGLLATEKPLLGLDFIRNTEKEIAGIIADEPIPVGEGPRAVLTANLDHIVTMDRRPEFRSAYGRAWLITADGMPVYAYGAWRGAGLPGRVTGADLFARLIPLLRPGEHRCFFVTPTDEVGAELMAILRDRGFRSSEIGFVTPAFGFERDAARSAELIDEIARVRATHLFFGLGAPKSELWTDKHREQLGECYVLHVGAALEFFAGHKARAPRLLQVTGLEWLWRWALEPRRLFRRYFVDSWRFLAIVRRDLAGQLAPASTPVRS